MRDPKFHSVFKKLFVSVMLALILFAVAMLLLMRLVYDNSTSTRSQIMATQVSSQIEGFLQNLHKAQVDQNRLQARFMLAVIKKTFDIFDESLHAKMGLYSPAGHLLVQTDNTDFPKERPLEPSWIARMFPIWAADRQSLQQVQVQTQTGYVLLYELRRPLKPPVYLAVLNIFTGTVLLLCIMSGVLWVIARSLTKRINQMSHQIRQLGDGDFSVRVEVIGNDEITTLAKGFNQAAQKIEHLINANNLLLAHASHELRTPITRIRLQIEMMDMLAQEMNPATKAMFDKRAKAVNRDLNNLNDLVESILLISRLDAGHALQKVEPLDLYDLVKQEKQHYPEATLKGDTLYIDGQAKLLTHLVRNLLNNAMLHGTPPIQIYLYAVANTYEADTIPNDLINLPTQNTDPQTDTNETDDLQNPLNSDPQNPPDAPESSDKDLPSKILPLKNTALNAGTLKNRLKKRKTDPKPKNQFAVLAVIDQGEGIPIEKRQDIFSPFVRLKQEKKGSGLGLSLVAQIVEAHKGHIKTDTWQGHTRFLVILPIEQQNDLLTAESLVKTEPKSDPQKDVPSSNHP